MRPLLSARAARDAGKAVLILACWWGNGGDAAIAGLSADGASHDAGSNLPAIMTASEDLLLAISINDYDTKRLAQFHRYGDGCLTVGAADLKEFNLKVPETAIHASGGVCLERMPGVTYRYDSASQSIYLKVSDDARVALDFDARSRRPQTSSGEGANLSAVFNYALFATGGTQDYMVNYQPQYQGASATVDGHIFSNMASSTNRSQRTRPQQSLTPYFLRLDTRWFYEDPDTAVTYSAGDVISGSLNWTTSIRMGGFQIRRDFALRPDLVTQPMPQFSSSAAVPSTIEVFANQTRPFSAGYHRRPFQHQQHPTYHRGQARCASCCATQAARRRSLNIPITLQQI